MLDEELVVLQCFHHLLGVDECLSEYLCLDGLYQRSRSYRGKLVKDGVEQRVDRKRARGNYELIYIHMYVTGIIIKARVTLS